MRFFRKVTRVCQNCINGNNDKGKFIYHWYRKGIGYEYNNKGKLKRDPAKQGCWYIFCERKKRFLRWNRYKRCFKPKEWVIKHNKLINRNGVLKREYRDE